MKETLLKILKITLLTLLATLLILLILGTVLALDWPLWVGICLIVLVAGMLIGLVYLRRIMQRRREQQFVQQVIEQDEAQLQKLSGLEKDDLRELQSRWKEAIEALRKSHLRKRGNPLYVLPWYLFLGESGSGKTTSIGSARLSSPFANVNRTSGISGTRNCDWWFFEQAVILDTAGRYAIPIDEERDREEWQKFMSLLLKYRKKEPLNGLIVTIAADKLAESTPAALEEDGRNIRRRIDELMRILGIRFPVYLLVTKCDLIQGMTHLCDRLPGQATDQPMGYLNQDMKADAGTFLDRAFESVVERLRTIRMLLLHQPLRENDPGLLLFPEEFANLKPGLAAFMRGAFKENPYQENVILRGMFFSSGRQEGSPFSHFLKALGLIGEREVLPGTAKGLFLHELFTKVLPKDRGLFAPTQRILDWRQVTRNIGLVAWVVIGIALCGLLSFSFVKNLKAIREASEDYAAPVMRGQLLLDLIDLDRLSGTILKLEGRNHGWWTPRFGLSESIAVERGLKSRYCADFRHSLLVSFDRRITQDMNGFTAETPNTVYGNYMLHLVRRINILKARLDEKGFEKLSGMPQPPIVSLASADDQAAGSDVTARFGQLYLHYVLWRAETNEIQKEIGALQSWVRYLLSRKTSLQWLAEWTDRGGAVPPVSLGDFWGGSQSPNEKWVSPSFTRKGREVIDAFITEIEAALPDATYLAASRGEFYRWYSGAAYDSWHAFAASFPAGINRLKTKNEWQQVALRAGTSDGPYWALFDRLTLELGSAAEIGDVPAWFQQVYQYQVLRSRSQGTVVKAAEEGMKMMSAIEKRIRRDEKGGMLEAQLNAVKVFQEYVGSIGTIRQSVASRPQTYQMALQAFTEDPATGKSPFVTAHGALQRLQGNFGAGKAAEPVIGDLIAGPFNFLWMYSMKESACSLQAQWEEKVLADTQGAASLQKTQMLLAPEGPVWKFVKGPAAPFIGWNVGRGYHAKEIYGSGVPLEGQFLAFLGKGAKVAQSVPGGGGGKTNYTVAVKGFPIDANPDARIKPHGSRIELQCVTGPQTLINHNYPVAKTFTWSPDTCTDVVFQIEAGDVVITKRYTGEQAFPEFIHDFPGGSRTFQVSEFPNERRRLEQMGIKNIKVHYSFSGQQDMLKQVRTLPGNAPRGIAKCWDR